MEERKDLALYETLFIIRPEQGGKVKEFIDKFKKVVEQLGATVIDVEEWGIRDLAYPIQKQSKGYYNLMRYRASGATVEELERNMKLSEGLMRHLSVRLDEDVEGPSSQAAKNRPQAAGQSPEEDLSKAGSDL
ncbi:MAG: 30S ribosomal protein S6 [Candidatus Binatia bacterium]